VTTGPGWYPNQDGTPSLRYWNGKAWTDGVALTEPASQPPPVPEPGSGVSRKTLMDRQREHMSEAKAER
jgi:Protein of unknown function (DUF2510)